MSLEQDSDHPFTLDIVKDTQRNEIVRNFHRCMSNLKNPGVAVKTGEYKKCVKEIWEKYPQFKFITINRPDKNKKIQVKSIDFNEDQL